MNKDRLNSLGLLFLRLLAGAGILHHGYERLFTGRMAGFAEGFGQRGLPFPAALAWGVALSEFLGGLLLVLGLRTRMAAAFIFATMSLAAFVQYAQTPLVAKELALAYWTASGTLLLTGGGRYGLDRF